MEMKGGGREMKEGMKGGGREMKGGREGGREMQGVKYGNEGRGEMK